MSNSKEVRYTSQHISPQRGRSQSRSPSSDGRRRSRSRSQDGGTARNPGNNLYVTGLSTRITNDDIEKYFSKEGKVTECQIVLDPRSKESRGFAFVTMESVEDADRCIKYLDRSVFEGRRISVQRAKRRRGRTPTPGKYCGPRGSDRKRSRSPSPYRPRGRGRSRDRRERSPRSPSPHRKETDRRRKERSRSADRGRDRK